MTCIQTSFKPLLSFFVRELILPHASKVPGYGGIVDTEIVILNQRIIEVRTLCLEGNKGKLTARNVAHWWVKKLLIILKICTPLHWQTSAQDPAENVMFVMCPPAVPEFITSILWFIHWRIYSTFTVQSLLKYPLEYPLNLVQFSSLGGKILTQTYNIFVQRCRRWIKIYNLDTYNEFCFKTFRISNRT